MATPETKLKNKVRAFLTTVPHCKFDKISDRYMTGFPDFVCCVQGRYVALEGKSKKNKLSTQQVKHKRQTEKSGGLFLEYRTVEEVIQAFAEWDLFNTEELCNKKVYSSRAMLVTQNSLDVKNVYYTVVHKPSRLHRHRNKKADAIALAKAVDGDIGDAELQEKYKHLVRDVKYLKKGAV